MVIMAARHAVVTGDLKQSELGQLIAKESEVLEEAGSAMKV